jgi:anti-sigma factor ChrR (cupin superfamily)
MEMKRPVKEEISGQAAMYALGALSQQEASRLEDRLAEKDLDCLSELRSFEKVVAYLSFAAPSKKPPAGVLSDLLDYASQSKAAARPAPRSLIIRKNEGGWTESVPGVFTKRLFADETRGTVTTLYRIEPGAVIESHRHLGVEECYVLEGDWHINGQSFGAGDYICSPPGSADENLYTLGGTMLLIIAPEGYEAF